jgi:hypothetical protein
MPANPSSSRFADIRVAIVGLDELPGFVTLRVTGYYTCAPPCESPERVAFASLDLAEHEADRMPRSAAVTLSAQSPEVSQTLQLPVHGDPLSYPFDSYEMLLGISLQQIGPDGYLQPLMHGEADDRLRLTIRDALPLFEVPPFVAIDPITVRPAGQPYAFLYVESIAFRRPLYLQIFAVVMVALTAVVAAFAVFMRPLTDLVVSASGLILAIWGIRSLMVPSNITYPTLVDLGLGTIMGFLLTAIAVRGLMYLVQRNRVALPPVRVMSPRFRVRDRERSADEASIPRSGVQHAHGDSHTAHRSHGQSHTPHGESRATCDGASRARRPPRDPA